MSNSDSSSVYAAAQGRSFLRGELQDKPNEWVREFAGLIDDSDTLDLLNYLCSLWRDEPESFLETELGQQIVRSASTKMADRAFRDGNVSQLQGLVGLTDRTSEGSEILTDSSERLQNEGAIGLVLGPPGAGKTALTLDVARVWAAQTGGHVIGNTDWDGFDAVVNSDTELLEWMGHNEGPVLAVIDETAQDLSGFGSGSKQAEAFSDSLTFVRKKEAEHGPYPKRGSVLMVNHTRTKTAKPFRDLCTFAIEKPHRNDPGRARLLDSEGGTDSFEELKSYKGISDTRENYAEHEASEFLIEGADDGDDGESAASPDDVRRQEHIRTVVQACKPWDDETGMSYPDASDLVPYGDSWVGNRVREWRDGEHRDIVAAPDGGNA